MKKITAITLSGLLFVFLWSGYNIESQVLPHSRPINRWLKDWAKSGYVITLSKSAKDSTERFPVKPYMNVYLYCAQANDSTSANIIAKAARYDTTGTFRTAYTIAIDTAAVSTAGGQYLIWNWSSNALRNNYNSIDFSTVLTDEVYFEIKTDGDTGLNSTWLISVTGAGD